MRYVCLVYGEESLFSKLSKEEMAVLNRDSLAYDRALQTKGHYVVAEALQPVRTAKQVRRRGGKVTVVDGPFAETKEQLLGFIMIEADNPEKALEIAADIPLASLGTVEVRAVFDVPES